jgi:hypothetical protein
MVAGFFHLVWKFIWNAVLALVCSGLIFIGYKANQPMSVAGVPKGMTYVEFIQNRVDAAKTVEPSRCGWGMMASLAILGPIYSVVYTEVGIHPNGFLARGTANGTDIPKDVAGTNWYELPGIWWNTVERLTWTMVGKPALYGCKFRPAQAVIGSK